MCKANSVLGPWILSSPSSLYLRSFFSPNCHVISPCWDGSLDSTSSDTCLCLWHISLFFMFPIVILMLNVSMWLFGESRKIVNSITKARTVIIFTHQFISGVSTWYLLPTGLFNKSLWNKEMHKWVKRWIYTSYVFSPAILGTGEQNKMYKLYLWKYFTDW